MALTTIKIKNHAEINDADDRTASFERSAQRLLESRERLEREMSLAAADAARLRASLPSLEAAAVEAEVLLERTR